MERHTGIRKDRKVSKQRQEDIIKYRRENKKERVGTRKREIPREKDRKERRGIRREGGRKQ